MIIDIVHTGSDGNCSFISDGITNILLDCGIRLDIVNRTINYKLAKIDAVLITHQHDDHTKYIKKIADMAKPIYMGHETKDFLEKNKIKSCFFRGVSELKTFQIGTFLVKPFPLMHYNFDGTNCQNFGYLIYSTSTKEKLLWATDTEYIKFSVPKCDYLAIEMNYDNEITFDGAFDVAAVDKRRFISHQSLQTVKNWLVKQDLSVCKKIFLIHISKEKIDKEKAKKEIEDIVKCEVII